MTKELIEQLAKEHAIYVEGENQYTEYIFDYATLEAFAKAYQAQTQGKSE